MGALLLWLAENVLLPAAMKFGIPYVLQFLQKKFPFLSSDKIQKLIDWLVEEMKKIKTQKQNLKKQSKEKVRECLGVGCPMDLKK